MQNLVVIFSYNHSSIFIILYQVSQKEKAKIVIIFNYYTLISLKEKNLKFKIGDKTMLYYDDYSLAGEIKQAGAWDLFKPALIKNCRINPSDILDVDRYEFLQKYHENTVVEKHFINRGNLWLNMPPFIAPYSSVPDELALVEKIWTTIENLHHQKPFIFDILGTGNLNTEIEPIRLLASTYVDWSWSSPKPPLFIELIDANPIFLDLAVEQLSQVESGVFKIINKDFNRHSFQMEYDRNYQKHTLQGAIYIRGVCGYFQNYLDHKIKDIPYLYILFGNTLSNFENQKEAANLFYSFLNSGDYLLMGVRKKTDEQYILELYCESIYFHQFLGVNKGELNWELENGAIRALDKQGQLKFVSRSYTVDEIKNLFENLKPIMVQQTNYSYKLLNLKGSIIILFKKE